MPFKSIIQDMRGEISRKGFGYGIRSRSNRAADDFPADDLGRSCWANLPPELLRDVLMRIEESESGWRSRKNVVSCAGVCKGWREIMKEIVANLEISGKLTFPVSLKQPGPRNSFVRCFIKRCRGMQTYHLYLNLSEATNDEGKFLLAARRCRRPAYTDYVISLKSDDVSKGNRNYVGKLRSNFLGTKFTIYESQPSNGEAKVAKSRSSRIVGTRQVSPKLVFPAGDYPVTHVSYELNVLGSRGPRRMLCVMDNIPVSAINPEGVDSVPAIPFFRSKSTVTDSFHSDNQLILKNKLPRWHDQLQCWCLNFNGRVTVASVKNFQLVASGQEEEEKVILQFGKVGKDTFTMDYRYPVSAFQAFAICLSSFDTKIACE